MKGLTFMAITVGLIVMYPMACVWVLLTMALLWSMGEL